MTRQHGAIIRAFISCVLVSVLISPNAVAAVSASRWLSTDVGSSDDVGIAGSAVEANGVWLIQGAGSDIWGTQDAFHFLHRRTIVGSGRLIVRVDDLQNSDAFAKAGLMVRTSLDAGAATVILDMKPSGEIEFMSRRSDGAEMVYWGGESVTAPAWLKLEWAAADGGSVYGYVSQDGATWRVVSGISFPTPTTTAGWEVGVAVTSHTNRALTTSHVEGLSLLPLGWTSTDIGNTGLTGNAVYEVPQTCLCDIVLAVEGAGSDVWGTADAFQFVHFPVKPNDPIIWRVQSLDDTHEFAKAGLMMRDGLAPDAASVILDVKPSGEVEFMARLCAGCETTYLGGTTIAFGTYLRLMRTGSTFFADVSPDFGHGFTRVGSVDVEMSAVEGGFVVTSHDVSRITTAVFDHPER